MTFPVLTDQITISRAVNEYKEKLRTFEDVLAFLKEMNIEKDNSLRLFSWLVALGIIDDQKPWDKQIYTIYDNYYRDLKQHFNDKIDDETAFLKLVKRNSGNIIKGDIDRSIGMFYSIANELKLQEMTIKNAHLHSCRILALISLNNEGLSYTQGFDRYVLTCLCLALYFTEHLCLIPELAESLAYNMSVIFIKLAKLTTFIDDVEKTQKYFERMDIVTREFYPKLANQLEQAHHSSFHYALRWEILMFAEEHKAKDLLLLWDHIVINKSNYEDFIFYLCIAHVLQVPLAKKNEILVERIQNYKKWDVKAALNTTYKLLKNPHPSKIFTKENAMLAIVGAALLLGAIIFRKFRY